MLETIVQGAQPSSEACAGQPSLSQREREVLGLLARGFAYAEIARFQNLSVHTTRTYVKNLYHKLGVHSRSEAVYEAAALGLLLPEFWNPAVRGTHEAR